MAYSINVSKNIDLTGSLIDALVKFSIQEFTSILIPTTEKWCKEKLTQLKNVALIFSIYFSSLSISEQVCLNFLKLIQLYIEKLT